MTWSTDQLAGVADRLRALAPCVDDADRIERLRQFEELTATIAAIQNETMVRFAASQRQVQLAAGVAAERAERGVAAQVAFALRVSPHVAARRLSVSRALVHDLPSTHRQLLAGQVSSWRATLVARETAHLSREHRMQVDAELAGRLGGWSDGRVAGETRRAGYRLDAAGAVRRARRAESERRVTVRPAPDSMAYLTILAPCAQAVAAYAALTRHADSTTAGDDRSRSQIMADTALERLTGQASADAVPVEIELVMTDQTLLDPDCTEPGEIVGYGPVPAGVARDLALGRHPNGDATDASRRAGRRWLRRLFTSPDGTRLVQMETHRREFTRAQSDFVRRRDRVCRTPWCDAPIRHADHVRPHARGGPTSVTNADGLCEACNYAYQAAGWSRTVEADGTIRTTTPTGHIYLSRAPAPPGRIGRRPSRLWPVDVVWADLRSDDPPRAA